MITGVPSVGHGAEEHQYNDDMVMTEWSTGMRVGVGRCIVCIPESYIYCALVALGEARTSFRRIKVYNPY